VDAVRIALQPHLHDTELSVEKAAKICGYEKRKLARLLSAQGTTIAKEVAALRAAVAREKLAESKIRIAEIGTAVGFKDPTVFSRAFKNWTGQSPQEYRRNNRV
jgi:AraC-like DNA-binding protein